MSAYEEAMEAAHRSMQEARAHILEARILLAQERDSRLTQAELIVYLDGLGEYEQAHPCAACGQKGGHQGGCPYKPESKRDRKIQYGRR